MIYYAPTIFGQLGLDGNTTSLLLEEHHDAANGQPSETGPCCEEGHVLLSMLAKSNYKGGSPVLLNEYLEIKASIMLENSFARDNFPNLSGYQLPLQPMNCWKNITMQPMANRLKRDHVVKKDMYF
jgi:hypothetical protein